jgi:glutathione S-transferase
LITVHHLDKSRSHRVLWLLEELGVPYEVARYARDPETLLAPPELKKVHPLGKSPVVVDGGVTVAESGAIAEYLIDRYGEGRLRPPPGTPERRRYTYWLHFAEGSAMPPLLLKLVLDRIRGAKAPFFVKPVAKAIADRVESGFVRPNLDAQQRFIDDELARDPWFAGPEFSAADIQMGFPMEAAAARAGLDERYPNARSWLARVRARPAFRRAEERGGEFAIAS